MLRPFYLALVFLSKIMRIYSMDKTNWDWVPSRRGDEEYLALYESVRFAPCMNMGPYGRMGAMGPMGSINIYQNHIC